MTPDIFMDTFTLVRNRLEKQDTRFREAFPTEKSSDCFQDQPPEVFYEKRPEVCNFIKKEALAQVFSCEFCEISKNTFFTEHLWTTASVLYGV